MLPVFMVSDENQFGRIPRCGEFLRDPVKNVFGTVVAISYDLRRAMLGLDLLQCDGSRVNCAPFFQLEAVEENHPEYLRAQEAGILESREAKTV
jgi:hypothetical protein